MLIIKAGATSQTVYLFIQDSSVTTGEGLAGLVFNTAGLTAYYVNNRGAATSITLASLASATAAWTSGGFIAVDGTNMRGVYRLDLPDAVVASGNQAIVTLRGATNMVSVSKEIFLTAIDAQDSTSMGISRIDASVTSRMATYTQPTGFLAATFPTTVASPTNITAGTITTVTNLTNLPAIPNNWITAAGIATDAITAAKVAADAVAKIGTGVWANPTKILTAGTNIVLAKGTGITGFNDITAANVWANATRTLSAGTNIVLAKGTGVTGFNDLSAAQVKTQADSALSDVGLTTTVTGRIDAAISTRLAGASYTAPDNSGIAAIKERTDRLPDAPANQETSLSIEEAVDSISDNVDAPVSSRLAAGDYTAPDNTGISTIKAKTDQLAFYSGSLNSNIKYVNDVEVKGNGSPGNKWGP